MWVILHAFHGNGLLFTGTTQRIKVSIAKVFIHLHVLISDVTVALDVAHA